MIDIKLSAFGARGDGSADNSAAFTAALGALRESGGGILRVEAGTWRTGPLELFSHTTLALEEGAVLSFIPEPDRYTPVQSRWEGVECYAMHPCVFAGGQEHITITGTGRIDGNGEAWWKILREKRAARQTAPETPVEKQLAALNADYQNQPGGGGGRGIQFLRPPLVQFFKCRNVRLEGITLENSPFWTVHPVYCEDLEISGIRVRNPHDAPNTDGIDIDSCRRVLIENCHVSVGDDGIALKSGSGEDGVRVNRSAAEITIRNCTVENGHGGVVIGSETAGGIGPLRVENCRFRGTDRGIRIKTRRGRGGRIQDLEFRDLVMENNLCPLAINMYYRCGSPEEGVFSLESRPLTAVTPSIKDIRVINLRASGCRASAGFIAGLPESPVENLVIKDCEFSTDEASGISTNESDMFLGIPEVPEKSVRLLNVKNLSIENVKVRGPAEEFIYH
jgi:polygalacturonase